MKDIEGFTHRMKMNPFLKKQLCRNEKSENNLDGVDMKDHKSVLNAVKEHGNCLWKKC